LHRHSRCRVDRTDTVDYTGSLALLTARSTAVVGAVTAQDGILADAIESLTTSVVAVSTAAGSSAAAVAGVGVGFARLS